MKFLIGIAVAFGLIVGATSIQAQQPPNDRIVIDQSPGCVINVYFVDGVETSTGFQVSVNGALITGDVPIPMDDIFGPQSGLIYTFKANAGDAVVARLFIDGEPDDVDVKWSVKPCPTPTATPTNTATTTPTSTSTPVPTATAVPPTATPVVIQVPVVVQQPPVVVQQVAPTPVVIERTVTIIRPPSTGTGGIKNDWSWGGQGGWSGGSGGIYCYFGWC